METIRTYLDNLFLQLPKTPEVLRAKEELLSMMEDKYEELKSQGKQEHEAVGTVISEFGNLNEILEELGVEAAEAEEKSKKKKEKKEKQEAFEEAPLPARILSFDEVREYLQFQSMFALMIGLGVALCITSPVGLILGNSFRVGEALGLVMLFLFITAAVGLFIYFGIQYGKYSYLTKEVFALDEITEGMVLERYEVKRSTFAAQIVLGVTFCILSVVPVIIFSEVGVFHLEDTLGPAMLLVLVAIGVFFFIYAGVTRSSYDVLLQKKEYSLKKKKKHKNKYFEALENSYWGIVTVIYLIWSFVWHKWAVSWIIWVIAGVFWGVVESLWEPKDK